MPPTYRSPNVRQPELLNQASLDSIFQNYYRSKQNAEAQNTADENASLFQLQNGFDPRNINAEAVRQARNPAPTGSFQGTPVSAPSPVNGVNAAMTPQAPAQFMASLQMQPQQGNGQMFDVGAYQPAAQEHPLAAPYRAYISKRDAASNQESRFKESEINKNNGAASATTYTLDQAASLPGGGTKEELAKLFLDGKVPKDYAHMRSTNHRAELQLGEKESQFDTKQWEEINRKTNPAVAGPRTLVGMAGTLNAKADRALKNLNDPNATPQQIAGAVADTASILAGGAADDHAIKSQTYDTLETRLANLKTLISSKPQMANQPEVVAQLKKVIGDIREVDNKVIQDNLNTYENIHSDTIKRNPEKWAKHKANILGSAGIGGNGGGAKNDPLGIL